MQMLAYDAPTPDGHTLFAVYDDFFWIALPDGEYTATEIDEIVVSCRAVLRRKWQAWRREQIGMHVIDGGAA